MEGQRTAYETKAVVKTLFDGEVGADLTETSQEIKMTFSSFTAALHIHNYLPSWSP